RATFPKGTASPASRSARRSRLNRLDVSFRSIATAIALFGCVEATAVDINQPGPTGAWYQATMSGQGIMLEVYPDTAGPGIGRVQASWLTFSPIGYWDYNWEH